MSRRKYRYLFLFSMILFLVGLISPVMCKSAEYLDICTEEGLQINPVAAWNTKQRKYLAVWYSQHDPAGIYGICLDPNGESLGDPTRISSVVNTSDKNHAPGISYDSDKDQYLISWHDSDPDKDQSKDIYAAFVSIDEEGSIEKVTSIDMPKARENQLFPKVAWNGDQFLVVWYDFRNGQYTTNLKSADIYGVRIDPNGQVLDPNSMAICKESSAQVDPVVAGYSGSEGKGWVVSWVDERNSASSGKDIYATFIKQYGNDIYQQEVIPICTAATDQEYVSVAVHDEGFLIVWMDARLKGEVINGKESGNCIMGLGLMMNSQGVLSKISGDILFSMLDLGKTTTSIGYVQNNYVITWNNTSSGKVYGIRFSFDSGVLDTQMTNNYMWPKPFVLSDPDKVSSFPSVAFNSELEDIEDILITWMVTKDSDNDIAGVIYTPPEPPLLEWAGTSHFTDDGVDPDSAKGGSQFTFKVKFKKSTQGSSEASAGYLMVDLDHDGLYNRTTEYFKMEKEDNEDEEDGLIYKFEGPILYDGDPDKVDGTVINYKFYFKDEFNVAKGEPTDDHELTILPNGHVPLLSWLGTGKYVQDGLDPDTAEVDVETNITFKVKYQDNSEPKKKQIWIDLDRDNIFEDSNQYSEKFDLTKESGSDYDAGVTYSFEKDILPKEIGLFAYRFYFDDGSNVAQGEPKDRQYLVIACTSETIIHSGLNEQQYPDIALTSEGGLIVWEDLRDIEYMDTDTPVYYRSTRYYKGSKVYGLLLNADGDPIRSDDNYGEIRIGTDDKNQFNPRVAGQGNIFLVVWEDLRNGEIKTGDTINPGYWNKDIYGQVVDMTDPNNIKIKEVAIATYTCGSSDRMSQLNPSVAAGEENTFFVVWEDTLNLNSSGKDLYANLVSYDPQTGLVTVSQNSSSYIDGGCIINEFDALGDGKNQTNPAVAWASTSQKYLVVWEDYRYEADEDSNPHLYGNPVDPTGQVADGINPKDYNKTHGNTICTDPNTTQTNPSIASDGENFLVVWEHELTEVNISGKDIYGIRVKPTGETIGGKFPICTSDGDQTNPRVCWDNVTGRYLVAWASQPLYKKGDTYTAGDDSDIKCAWIDSDGELISRDNDHSGWEISAVQGVQTTPALSGNEQVNRVVWADDRTSIYAPDSLYSSDIYSISIKSLLNWPDDEDFSYGVNPGIGGNGKEYTFKINYLNIKDEEPNIYQVWVDLNGNGEYEDEEKKNLTKDPDDTDTSDGQIYFKKLTVTIPDNMVNQIGYRFYFEHADGSLATGSANLQHKTIINPPWLSWTDETNFSNKGVNPQSGNKGTSFEFRVGYIYIHPTDFEAENVGPDITEVWVDVDLDGDYQENEKLKLTEDDNEDTDYTDGKIYSTSLKVNNVGVYKYRFHFEHRDGGIAIGEPTQDNQFIVSGDTPSEGPGWTTYTTPDLPNNYITCLAVRSSTLWVGTGAGLATYDGSKWSTITPAQQSKLAGTTITDMVLDKSSNILYLGTTEGLSSFDGSTWKLYDKEATQGVLDRDYINTLTFDKHNKILWMSMTPKEAAYDPNASDAGLISYKISGNTWTKYTKANTSSHTGGGLPSDSILALAVDENGDLWVSSFISGGTSVTPDSENQFTGKGISRFTAEQKEWTHYTISSNNSDNILKTDIFWKLAADQKGTLWAGGVISQTADTDGGLYQFDIGDSKWLSHFYNGQSGVMLGSNTVSALCVTDNGLWVGTWPTQEDGSDGGASFYNGSTWVKDKFYTMTTTKNGLVSNGITAIAVQGEEIWFGTPQGLSRYGYGGGGGEENESPFPPKDRFFFPGKTGCFTNSFSQVANNQTSIFKKYLFKYGIGQRIWIIIMTLIFIGMVFFYILRRYIWTRG